MIYDGDCSFCCRWIQRWRFLTEDRIEYTPYQEVGDPFHGIAREQFERAVHLIEPNGDVTSGANAVFRALSLGAKKRWPAWLNGHVPGVAWITEAAYRFVAGHRRGFSFWTSVLWGAGVEPPSYFLSHWLFIRLIAFVYLIAFVSLGVQVLGLIGSNGILPASDFLEFQRNRLGDTAYWEIPTLAWLNCSDQALQWACWGGAGLALLAMLGIASGPLLLVMWALYLSLYRVGQTFLSFQWDLLLLEAGFLAVFFASWRIWPRLAKEAAPSRVMRCLILWLLFRLIFCSGVVKLLDDDPNDPTWHNLTALNYHYETTCIPTPISWYAHQLPEWFQKFSVVCMFVIEIGIAFLIFIRRRPQLIAFFALVFLQVLIILTGNYNFFNLLSIALCLPLLDDAFLRRFFPSRMRAPAEPRWARRRGSLPRRVIVCAVALVTLPVTGIWMVETFRDFRNLPRPMQEVLRVSMRFGSINNYGLFRSMTTRRPEIIIEGSNDRRTWKAYEFKWKPGDLNRPPPVVAPHQPRLDWQMWFAALGNVRSPRNQWFVRFTKRLLEGSPEVLALLETNPFPDKPPLFIRALRYDYHFTDWETRRETGAWWTRNEPGVYLRPVNLNSFRRR